VERGQSINSELPQLDHRQREARGAALAEVARREAQRGPLRGNSGPSSLGELYVRYKAEGRLAEFW
jgi:hypothetical protein